jgi:DNA-binding NarL/FixJ family response regulator
MHYPESPVSDVVVLTMRQWQILGLWMSGMTVDEIAAEIGVGKQTVSNHIHRLIRKLAP